MIKRGKKYCQLSELKVNVGEAKLLLNQKITKILKVKTYNLLVYKKHKYRQKYVLDKWYILSNLSSPEKIKKIYSQRMGIEAMFKPTFRTTELYYERLQDNIYLIYV